ncbi:farnesyl pyrophosphate synthase isoform X2 [Hyalella azteca]|uniref:Farnesyl pyrophosphate synthase n=2 Tax=Hyalella azteca TaxID=294128 RepID=A0A8B7N6K2_HYAAZ|nr:farnesyl pyrophosphate synthase isoform X2 [Hyalella azteca]
MSVFFSILRNCSHSHGINAIHASKLSMYCGKSLPLWTAVASLHPSFLSKRPSIQPCCAMSSIVLPPAKLGKAASSDEQLEFVSLFPDVVRDLSTDPEYDDIPEALKWFSRVLQYNVRGGKMNRGLAVGMSYKLLAEPSTITPGTIRQAHILGWCIELLQSYFLVADDIIDNSPLRRGRPAWHVKDNRGLAAFNDAILLEAGIYKILKKHFQNEPYYTRILELFHSVTLKTSLGQTLDLQSNPGGKPQLDQFTMDRYNAIVRYKTGFYSFYLPVALAMYMAGITDAELHRQARTILLEMGSFFQVQDDYLDCFGDASVTGKVGTDIGEGKCTWLAVVALQRASPAQRALMEQHYGSSSDKSVEVVTTLYKELGLPATYRSYEESTYALIRMHVQQISRGLNHKVFFKFLDKIHLRSV